MVEVKMSYSPKCFFNIPIQVGIAIYGQLQLVFAVLMNKIPQKGKPSQANRKVETKAILFLLFSIL